MKRHLLAMTVIVIMSLLPAITARLTTGATGNIALIAHKVVSADSTANLRRFAQRYALVFHVKPKQVPTLRAENPKLVILAYDLPGGEGKFEEDWDSVAAHPEWFATDTKGSRLYSNNNFWLLRIGSLAYRRYEVEHITNVLSSADFDGVYFDEATPWYPDRESFFNESGQPTEPDSALVATWPQDMLTFHAEMKSARGAWWHIMNTWPLGPQRHNEWKFWLSQYLSEVTGVSIDGFGYNREKPWRESAWRFQVAELQRLTAMGKTVIAKCPAKSTTDRDRLQTFCFASYLLAADGRRAYFYPAFDIDDGYYNTALYAVPLGEPLGSYAQDPGTSIYRRAFAGGFVIVNPSGTKYTTVPLGGTYRTLTGSTVTNVILMPYSAAIVLK